MLPKSCQIDKKSPNLVNKKLLTIIIGVGGPYRKRDQAFTSYLLVANAPLILRVTTTILIMTALITLLIMTIFKTLNMNYITYYITIITLHYL